MSSIILLILVTVFLLMPMAAYLIFWYEAANSPYGRTLERESKEKPFWWLLRGLLSSICCNIVAVSLFPLGFIKKLWWPNPKDPKKGPPVVLIHGLYHNAGAWVFYRWQLRRKGYGRIYVFTYNSWKNTFWDIYEKLETWMARVEQDCAEEDLVMVGHSMGGLLAKTYAGKRGASPFSGIRRVITLSSPYKGSKMVVFGLGLLADSLGYRSPLIRELENFKPATNLPCVAFYSPVDNMVLPPESLMPPEGWIRERTAPLGHMGALYHGPTFNRVLSYIEDDISNAA